MPDRQPCVAGSFYPDGREDLLRELEACIPADGVRSPAVGVLAPHAGYLYSGRVAGEVYARVQVPETVVLACPNHTGVPVDFSLWREGAWETPLGKVPVETELADRIFECCPGAESDCDAHLDEHANEVHLPFLQKIQPGVRIVPVVVRASHRDALKDFGHGLAMAIRAYGRPALIVASSDMTHRESHESARTKDRLAIDQMLRLDEDGLWNTVRSHRISMCGYGPAVLMIRAAKDLGATRAELVRYATSGEVSGDYGSVVGYAGMVIS
ncbi:MAG: AmmeMemoRadiSam system protein B [Planctomycetes bacterium]|nr:AmmeMemoRadiSam system protein B [Planctomycetota bacterium]